jgi:hypothetical protein
MHLSWLGDGVDPRGRRQINSRSSDVVDAALPHANETGHSERCGRLAGRVTHRRRVRGCSSTFGDRLVARQGRRFRQCAENPAEQIAANLFAIQFIEHFLPPAGVEPVALAVTVNCSSSAIAKRSGGAWNVAIASRAAPKTGVRPFTERSKGVMGELRSAHRISLEYSRSNQILDCNCVARMYRQSSPKNPQDRHQGHGEVDPHDAADGTACHHREDG